MASADVKLKVDQPTRLFFAHSPTGALVFAVIGGVFAWLSWSFASDAGAVRYIVTGFSLLFVLAGVLGFFWRHEIDIDLATRQVQRRRGFWPAAQSSSLALAAADAVLLEMKYRSSGSSSNRRKVPWWYVSIRFSEDEKATRIFSTRSEVDGYAKWEYFAKRLQLDAINATEPGAVERKHWDDLDDSLAAKKTGRFERPLRAPTPPHGSGIDVVMNEGRKEIVITAAGFNGGLVFLVIFGGLFAAMGTFTLLAGQGVIDVPVSGSETALAVVPPVFIVIGLGIIWLGVKGSYSAKVIAVNSGNLVTENLAFGRRSGREEVPLAKIESVTISGDVRSKRPRPGRVRVGGVALGSSSHQERKKEVVVRTDGRILRFGRSLDDAAKTWLEGACRYAVVHGQLP